MFGINSNLYQHHWLFEIFKITYTYMAVNENDLLHSSMTDSFPNCDQVHLDSVFSALQWLGTSHDWSFPGSASVQVTAVTGYQSWLKFSQQCMGTWVMNWVFPAVHVCQPWPFFLAVTGYQSLHKFFQQCMGTWVLTFFLDSHDSIFLTVNEYQ